MDFISRVFDLLDGWRHCPDYQLERRADIFFAAYLPGFLSEVIGKEIRDELVPEFPLRKGTLDRASPSNQSCKVDYLALSCDRTLAIFVELKTDDESRRTTQDDYLRQAKAIELPELLEGVVQLVRASDHKHKYCHLLHMLREHQLLELPADLDEALKSRRWASAVNDCLENVRIAQVKPERRVLYIVPNAHGPEDVGFPALAAWLDRRAEPIATRFAQSLRTWATGRAGGRP